MATWLAACSQESGVGTSDARPDAGAGDLASDTDSDADGSNGDSAPDTPEADTDDASGDAPTDTSTDQPAEDVTDGDAAADAQPDTPQESDIPTGPPVALLTLDDLPAEVNGSQPYFDHGDGPFDFTLVAPTFGFTLDLLADRPPEFLDPELVEVSCDAPFGPEGELPVDGELAGEFEWDAARVRWLVPESLALAADVTVTCTGRVANLEGEWSEPSSVAFHTMAMTPELDPFDPQDTWVVTFSRDRYAIELAIDGGDYTVDAEQVEGGNGEADFIEDLQLLGLQGDESGDGADTVAGHGAVGANAVVREWLVSETMRQVRLHYHLDPETGAPMDVDSVNIRIWREGDAGAPDPVTFDGSYSIHGVGGDAPPDDPAQFGRASTIDERNVSEQDDSQLGYGSFTSSVARQVLGQPAGRFLLREVLPESGVPIGESAYDGTILADGFDPSGGEPGPRNRYRQIAFLMEFLSKALSALIAHEIGHSLGLVACGPPPEGLFGGVYDDRWMESDPGCAHIDIAGLNIMQTGGALLANPGDVIQGAVFFEPLSLAYLRGRIILVP